MAFVIIRVVTAWVAFALVHSLTVSERYHAWLRRQVGDEAFDAFSRLAYTCLSFATFLALLSYLRSLSDSPLYAIPSPWRYGLRAGQLGALLFLIRTPLRLSGFLGIRQAVSYFRGDGSAASEAPSRLYTRKSYAIVRHPLYLGCSALLAFQPDQTLVSATSTIMAILYFYVGSFHEESRLLREFGEDYRDYQRVVPRLIPRVRGRRK